MMAPVLTPARLAFLAAVAAVVAPFAAGTTLGAIRFLSNDAEPLAITLIRLGIGAAILLPMALVFARGWPRGRDFWVLVGMGVVMFGFSQWLVSASLSYTSAARGGIIASTVPFMTLAVSAALRAEQLTWLKALGVSVSTGGVVLAAIAAASGVTPGDIPLTRENLLAIAYIGVIGSAFTYFLWLWALRHTTPSRVAIGLTMNPMGAMAAGAVILGEPITLGVWAGLGCIAGGILLANWRLQDRKAETRTHDG